MPHARRRALQLLLWPFNNLSNSELNRGASEMAKRHSFRFVDDELNEELIRLLKKARVIHRVDGGGIIHYSPDDEDLIGNNLICSIRDRLFPSWQIVSCPPEWTDSYRQYMAQHDIPFVEEASGHDRRFLIPSRYRPHSWKLEEPVSRQRA